MHASARTFAVVALIVILAGAVPSARQGEQARLTGRVTDGSGGALPGVTVTFSLARSKPVVVVTDKVGQYQSPPLPPDTYCGDLHDVGIRDPDQPGRGAAAG